MSDREAQFREMAKKTIVYRVPGMDEVEVRRDIPYSSTDEGSLMLDVYLPSTSKGKRPPVVVIAIGYPDPRGLFRQVGWHVTWARLLAVSGVAAVIYGNRQPAADVHAVLGYLRNHGDEIGIDARRIGVLTCSAHGAVALSALIRDPKLACAALVCPFTMDLEGATHVADASAQFMFVNACAGKSAADLPADVPVLFVRAGRDQFGGINQALDRLVSTGVTRNLPLTLVNHHTGIHAFDVEEDSEVVRGIIRQVLAFLCLHLEVR
jgi:hypothetical protein